MARWERRSSQKKGEMRKKEEADQYASRQLRQGARLYRYLTTKEAGDAR